MCSVKGCETPVAPHGARGLCSKHYKRLRAHGDPLFKKVAYPEIRGGINPSYNAIHLRLKAEFGRASNYECVVCGTYATDWACVDNKNQNGVNDGKPVTYSFDTADYLPMCRNCHNKFDQTS